jgi:hypothetical protein
MLNVHRNEADGAPDRVDIKVQIELISNHPSALRYGSLGNIDHSPFFEAVNKTLTLKGNIHYANQRET